MPELNNRPIVKYLDPKTGGYEYATVIDVGDLQLLNTQVKSDLVQAINSLFYDDRIGGGSAELTPEDLERLKNIQASIDSIKDGTFEIVNFGSINTYLNQEMNAKYEELVERLNQSNREMYDASLIDIQAAVDAATLAYEQKVAEQNALLDGAEKTLTDTKLALEETAKKLETADINYKSVKQTVDELNAYIEDEIKVIDMDNFNSMVSDYKTAVLQTKDRYGVDASKQTLSYLTGQVADTQAQMNIQAGEIELRAKTDQLQYIPAKKESNANPNLLFETIELLSSHWNREYGAMVTPNTFRYGKIGEFTSTNSKFTTVSDKLEIGETYTLSLYTNEQPLSKGPTDEKFAPTDDSFTPDDLTVIVDGKVVTMAIFEDLSSINGWCGVSGQFVATKENATISILSSGLEQTTHVGYISQPKLEKGLKVTPFISHVDDEIATVSTAFSLIKSQGDTILLQSQRVSKIGEDNDALKETVAGIQIESGKITTAVSELEKKTDDEISRVEGKIETEANRIALNVSNKTTDEKLSALNMDTRNRIVNSDFELSEYIEKTKNWNYHGWSTIVSDIFTVLKLDNINYLIADKTTTSSNLNNSVWMRSAPFEIQTGKKMNVQAEIFIASNPNNYQVIEIELFDDNNTLLSTVPINVSQYTSNVLRTVSLNNVPYNVFRVNFSTQIETEGVFKAQLKLGLRSGRGKVGFTKIMLNTSNMSEIDWAPAEEDNRIVQTKLESKIEILEDSISLMSEDERLDVLSGLLVQESGTFKISPQSILQEVTSTELGDKALVTKTFMNQTAQGWKQGLVSEDGVIQAINASEEEYLIAFDKVRVDGSLEAKHFMGNALTLSDGFKIADKDGNAVLMANNDGQVVMNISKLEINAKPVATKDDVDKKINEIELTPGPRGVSVVEVIEYYLATDKSKDVSSTTPGWTTSIQAITPSEPYLWNYEVSKFSDGTTSKPTKAIIIGRYGSDGVSIKNVINHYALGKDISTIPTKGWTTTPPATTETDRFLWNYEEIIYSDNTKTETPKAIIGTHGKKGADGIAGKDGVGLSSTVITYGLSTSETNEPTKWTGSVPTLTKGQYLWTKSVWTYTDGTTETGYVKTYIAKDGNDGDDGIPGKDGVGIAKTTITYAKSTNGVTAPTTGFASSIPSVPDGQFLWTKTVWDYTDGTSETGYSVAKAGERGPQGVSVNGVTEYYLATNASSGVTTSTSGWSTSIPVISATKQYLWNYEVTSFSNGSKSAPTTPVIIGRYGLNGDDGVSITNVINYYALSNDSNIEPTTGWKTTPLLTSPTNRYLWNYEEIIYSDNTKTTTKKSVIGTHGESGADGLPGKDGVGISKTTILYGISTSESTQPTAFSATVPPLVKGQYLWTKTEWTYTDGSTEVGHTKSYIAKDGNNGTDGLPGKDGVGIKSTSIHYAKSTSGTSHSGATWSTTVPSVPNGQYLWTRTTWTYDDNTTETGYSVAKMGETGPKGDKGDKGDRGSDGIAGKDGVGIKTTTLNYASSTSGTTTPTSGWQSTVPTVAAGNYLWTRTTWTYTDNSVENGYTVSRIGKDGNTGKDGIAGKDGVGISKTTITYAKSTNGTTAPTSGWDKNVPSANPGEYIWTKTVWEYTDSTTETGYSVGKIGNTGAKGDKGDKGDTGPRGLQGLQGSKGDQGIQGPKGVDGKSSYTHIAYANIEFLCKEQDNFTLSSVSLVRFGSDSRWVYKEFQSGTYTATTTLWGQGDPAVGATKHVELVSGFSVSDSVDKTHIGVYVNDISTDSTDPAKYNWTLIKGADGAKGLQGPKGNDGRTPYFHTAYANSADGKVDFSITDSDGKRFIGTATTYSDTNPTGDDPKDPSKYKWVDMVGSVELGINNLQRNSNDFSVSKWVKRENINTISTTYDETTKWTRVYASRINSDSLRLLSYPLDLSELEIGDKFVAEFDFKTNVNVSPYFNVKGMSPIGQRASWSINRDGSQEAKRIVIVGERSTYMSSLTELSFEFDTIYANYDFNIRNLSVHRGTIETGWTPAPEDVQANIDNIQVGGRNLLKGTSNSFEEISSNTVWWNTFPGMVKIPLAQLGLSEGDEVVFSGVLNADKTPVWLMLVMYWDENNYNTASGTKIEAGQTGISEVKTTIPKNTKYINFAFNFGSAGTTGTTISYKELKFEKGNKRTDWTPAPEDVQSGIDSKADSEATQKALNDATALLQTLQQEVQAAALDGELKDFIKQYNEEQKALDEDKKESNKRLQEALNSVSSLTTNMDNMSETWNFVDRFIKNTKEGIVVGNHEEGSYILIKEDRLSFFSNNEEVAFIAQNLMEISRGAFVEQIQISQYIFEKYGTNQLAIRYAG